MSLECTVDHWLAGEKKRLSRFVDGWKRNHRENPEMYPEKLELGEWDEQFRSWVNGCEE